jgi:hypothetical protein
MTTLPNDVKVIYDDAVKFYYENFKDMIEDEKLSEILEQLLSDYENLVNKIEHISPVDWEK